MARSRLENIMTLVKARKEYICDRCGHPITIGMDYDKTIRWGVVKREHRFGANTIVSDDKSKCKKFRNI